jgi:CheY-like chemotaxis protein
MSQKLSAAIAVIGIDIGKNSFHLVGRDPRGAIVLGSHRRGGPTPDHEVCRHQDRRLVRPSGTGPRPRSIGRSATTSSIRSVRSCWSGASPCGKVCIPLRSELPGILVTRIDVLLPRMLRIIEDLAGDWRRLDARIEGLSSKARQSLPARSGRFIMEFALSAPDAPERVRAIADPCLALILSDINMLGTSGLEMLPTIRAERPDVPITMINACDERTRDGARQNQAQSVC